jgi:hypothetical protein
MQSLSRIILISICFVFLLNYNPSPGLGYLRGVSASGMNLSASPSAAVIKVGDKAAINLTATGEPASGAVCFSEQGFPSTGFTLSFLPQCALVHGGAASGQLIVEVTPAAAPQNFTALIVATFGNQTASAPLTITVVPAIAPWIPWLGIIVFIFVIAAALFVRPRKAKSKKKNE